MVAFLVSIIIAGSSDGVHCLCHSWYDALPEFLRYAGKIAIEADLIRQITLCSYCTTWEFRALRAAFMNQNE